MILVSRFFCTLIFSLRFVARFIAIFVASASVFASADILQSCPQYKYPNKKANIIGMVRDLESNNLLYCEYHIFENEGEPNTSYKKTNVEYRAKDQQLIATKKVDYSPGLTRPNVVQLDKRNNELRSSINNLINGSANIGKVSEKAEMVDVNYRKPNTEQVEFAAIELEDMLVIDAGFDEAVKVNWNTLTDGKKLIIDFLSPVHLRTIKLTVKQSNDQDCYNDAYDNKIQACFLISPSNMLLNLFVKPLALTYDRASKRLLRFKGDVNITDAQGDTQSAVIQYYYEG
jgi:hypothetical protein